MITREADYAIRLILSLAKHQSDGDGAVSTASVAEQMKIPYRFLRRIVSRLAEKGLLATARGKGGGVRLGKPSSGISVFDIVDIFDPSSTKLNACLLDEQICDRSGFCPVHHELNQVQKMVEARLSAMTFDKLEAKA